jgi:hypothetical protein
MAFPTMTLPQVVFHSREQVGMLGIAIGNWREAARQCGLSEGRVLKWVVRYGWKLPKRIKRLILAECCRPLSVLSLPLNRFRNVRNMTPKPRAWD